VREERQQRLVDLVGVRPQQPVRGALEALARPSGSEWALALLARARAVVEPSDPRFGEALARSRGTGMRADLARAQLLYGEWLRRSGRRTAAREELRGAHELFAGWAPRHHLHKVFANDITSRTQLEAALGRTDEKEGSRGSLPV
jgi:hypothetical protein